MLRRHFPLATASPLPSASPLKPLTFRVNPLFDQAAHSGRGLHPDEIATFQPYQQEASREFAVSGVLVDVRTTGSAFLRQQGYTEIRYSVDQGSTPSDVRSNLVQAQSFTPGLDGGFIWKYESIAHPA